MSEVCKDADVKTDAVYALLRKRMRGNLHDYGIYSVFAHFGKLGSEQRGRRGSVITAHLPHAAVAEERADDADAMPSLSQNMRCHQADGGFSVCARYADKPHILLRISVHAQMRESKRGTDIRYPQGGHIRLRIFAVARDNGCHAEISCFFVYFR